MKKIAILGGGESGVGAAILAKDKGHDVFLSDMGTIAQKYVNILEAEYIPYEMGHPHSEQLILSADEIIKSPGIPLTAPLIRKATEAGIPIISEIEFAQRYTDAKMLCITGSNGKTTTTTLLWHILRKAGLDASVAGNIGMSLAWQVARDPHEYYVVELSSFQLDNMYDFHAHVAILLNITPDHLDRYDHKMELYADAKLRIARNQTPSDAFIYWEEDPESLSAMQRTQINARMLPFASHQTADAAAWINDDYMVIKCGWFNWEMLREQMSLRGLHNMYNSMAATLAAQFIGVAPKYICEGLHDFKAVEHRLESVKEIDGVLYINDSKATNVASTYYALESMTRPTILLLGGTDKGNDYNDILPFMKQKVKAVVAMGLDNKKITDFCAANGFPCADTHSLADAMQAARDFAVKGDVVLLSPACASFDLFKSYIDRGLQFKAAVNNIAD